MPLDRTPGKGIGHLFVMPKSGNLQKDIILGEGDMYHPGDLLRAATRVSSHFLWLRF